MTKKKNIENLARIIANRVRYHAPVVYDGEVDFEVLEKFGVDLSLPIFKFENELSKPLIKAFSIAKKIVNFNLVATQKSKCNFALYLPTNSASLRLLQEINKLNINYKTNSLYIPHHEFDYIKVGGKELKLKYNNFCLEKYENFDGILVGERQFVASGEFTIIELCNSNKIDCEIEISFNKNLKNGYYYFKRNSYNLEIKNLFSQEYKYLNSNLSMKSIFFSCVDGVENSCDACIKFSEKIKLKACQKKYFYLHFGDIKISKLGLDEVEKIYEKATKKCYKNFDVRISTTDAKNDNYFNNILPRDIWISWLNGQKNKNLERQYIERKQEVVTRKNNKVYFDGNYENFKRIYIFDGDDFRQVRVENGAGENALVIGNTSFLNLKCFSLDKIKGKGQICLQFK